MQTFEPLVDPSYIPCSNQAELQFLQRIISQIQMAQKFYINPFIKSQILSLLPMSDLKEKAKVATKSKLDTNQFQPEQENDIFVEELIKATMHWFKYEFFTWTNEPACKNCNIGSTMIGMDGPRSQEEKEGLGFNVEVYQCKQCKQIIRFPRFNNPVSLMKCRTGRCGEWANCFAMICNAIDVCPVRYISDWTDHVWIEIFSPLSKKWCHMDCCENTFDAPLLYEKGWGKKLNYILAISTEEVVDVTRRYTCSYEEVLTRRTKVSEQWLEQALQNINSQLQIWMTPQQLSAVQYRQQLEKEDLSKNNKVEKTEELQERITGSREWRDQRGESGAQIEIDSSIEEALSKLPTCFDWKNFTSSNKNQLHFVKQASITDNVLRLTTAATGQVGAAWLPLSISSKLEAFEIGFSFQAKTNGADGFAFVFHQQGKDAIGTAGGGLGYSGIQSSLAVEFDTYQGVDTCMDPNGNHISIHTAGKDVANSSHHNFSIACTTNQVLQNVKLNDGNVHFVKLCYYDTHLFIYLDGRAVLRVKYPLENVIDFSGKKELFIGFTAATGGISQQHDILSWYMKSSLQITNQAQQTHIPITKYIQFEVANIVGIEKRIKEVNDLVPSKVKMTQDEMDVHLKALFAIIQEKKSTTLNSSIVSLLQEKLLKWPVEYIFPILDLLRLVVIYVDLVDFIAIGPILQKILYIDLSSDPNKLLSFRLFTNMFVQSHSRKWMNENEPMLVDQLMSSFKISPNDKGQTKLAFVSIFVNYSFMLESEQCLSNADAHLQILSGLCEIVREQVTSLQEQSKIDDASNEFMYRLILCIGTLQRKNQDFQSLVQVMEAPSLLQSIGSLLNEKAQQAITEI